MAPAETDAVAVRAAALHMDMNEGFSEASERRRSSTPRGKCGRACARPNLEARAAAQSSPRRAATSERTAGSTSRVNAAFALARERGAARRALPPRPLRAANARGSRRDDAFPLTALVIRRVRSEFRVGILLSVRPSVRRPP